MGRISQAFARIPVKCIHTVYVHTAICTLNYSKKTWQICISRICLYIALLCRPAMSITQDVHSVVHKNSCETVFLAPILESPNYFPSKFCGPRHLDLFVFFHIFHDHFDLRLTRRHS